MSSSTNPIKAYNGVSDEPLPKAITPQEKELSYREQEAYAVSPEEQELAEGMASRWLEVVRSTNNLFQRWESRFHCKLTYDMYEGIQSPGINLFPSNKGVYLPYTLNLFYSTVETRLPSLTFSNPQFHLSPKPGRESIAYSVPQVIEAVHARMDALNTFVSDPENGFMETIEACILDSHFRFGIVEIDITDNWVFNPTVPKPALASDSVPTDQVSELEGPENVMSQQPVEEESELIYVKYIPATNFRINAGANGKLSRCDWCAYYDYVRYEDLASNQEYYKFLKGHSSLCFTDISSDYQDLREMASNDPETLSKLKAGDWQVLLHVFDNRKKVRYLINVNEEVVIASSKFPGTDRGKPRLPLEDMRFSMSLKYWYGLPPASQWISPQQTYNEQVERMRAYARKMLRKYLVDVSKFSSPDEIEKLMNGQDGVFAGISGDIDRVIREVPVSTINPESVQLLQIARADFDVASGVTSDQRGDAADRQTATQTRIIDQRTTIRESRQANIVANFLCRIGRQISLCQQELSKPFWIRQSSSPLESGTDEVYKLITSGDFGDSDFNTNIQLETISPLADEQRRNAFLEFLAIINQYPQFGLSTVLIQEMADKVGFRNQKVIEEFQQLALVQQMALAAQQGAGPGTSPGPEGGGYPSMPQAAGGGGELAQRVTAGTTPEEVERAQNNVNQAGIPTEMVGMG